MKRHSSKRMLVTCLFVTACGGHTCDDPPSGSTIPEGVSNNPIVDCANTGPQAEEFSDGLEYQCVGSGKPVMFTKVSCSGIGCTVGPQEMNNQISRFTFGDEAYENLSIGACCGNSAAEEKIADSCEYSCGTVACDQVLPYLKGVRASNDEMKKMCCLPTDSGGYDCQAFDALLDACKIMLDKYISRVQETDGWGDDDLSWNGYCKSIAARGIETPNVDTYNYDEECGGIYLGDLDFEVLTADVYVRNTCIYPRCDIATPPNQPLPSTPKSCTATQWSEVPDGWPETAGEPAIEANVDSGHAVSVLSGGLGSSLSGEGFAGSVTRNIADGKVLYGIENCDPSGICVLKFNDIYAHVDNFTMEGDVNFFGKKKLGIRDTYLYLNRISTGVVYPPDAAGNRYFEVQDGDLEVTLKGGAKGYFDFFIGGSDTYFDIGSKTMVAWNKGIAYGSIDSSGRLSFSNMEFIDGDLAIAVSFVCQIPNHAPTAKGTVLASVCGSDTVLDASASFDVDGDALTYEWYIDGQTYTESVINAHFGEGKHTAFLTVKDSKGLVGRLRVTFHSMDDHVPPEIILKNLDPLGTCGIAQKFVIDVPNVVDFCGGDILVTGTVVRKNGVDIVAPIAIENGEVTLEPGEYLIEWTAIDIAGNTTSETQPLNIRAGIRTTHSLRLNDGAKIVLQGTGYSAVSNSGTDTVALGVGAALGSILSRGNVSLADRSAVHGDIRTMGTVGYQNRDTITVSGSVYQNQRLTFGGLFEDTLNWVVFPPRSSQPLYFNPRTTPYEVMPGSYPETYLNSGATAILSAGTYYFKSLVVNDASQLLIDDTGGSVQIYVENGLNLFEPINYEFGETAQVFLGYKGTDQVNLEASFAGTLVAPNAKVVMGTAAFKTFSGRYVAKDLELGPNVVLTCDTGASESFEPTPSCSDVILNQNETDVDCGGDCAACPDGDFCIGNDDCRSGRCVAGICQSIPGACSESTASDLGEPGNALTVTNNGCIMVRNAYPSWWGSRNMQLQSLESGMYPVPYTWTNTCGPGSGNGVFTGDWQSVTFGPTNSQCATLIDLGGNGSGTVTLRYYAN